MASVDLHGKTWSEGLADFIDLYNRTLRSGNATSETLNVVHGYGSGGTGGTMRVRFRSFLEKHPRHLEYMPGETVDGNPGHTIVLPVQPLPEIGDMLAEQIWEYCETPRAQSKITGRFRRNGDPKVIQAIRSLEKQGRLRAVTRGRLKAYEAV